MDMDLLGLYQRSGDWTSQKVAGASTNLDGRTPCDEWDVRTLVSHMLDTQRYFIATGRGEEAAPPSATPPPLTTADPVTAFDARRADMAEVYARPGVLDRTGPALGIAFSDQLLHGWDLARATGQDSTMPDGLADAAYEMIHGRFSDDERAGVFKPEVQVAAGARAQDRLLGYTGRDPELAV